MLAWVFLLNRFHKTNQIVIKGPVGLCLAGCNGCLLPLREVETLIEEGLV